MTSRLRGIVGGAICGLALVLPWWSILPADRGALVPRPAPSRALEAPGESPSADAGAGSRTPTLGCGTARVPEGVGAAGTVTSPAGGPLAGAEHGAGPVVWSPSRRLPPLSVSRLTAPAGSVACAGQPE